MLAEEPVRLFHLVSRLFEQLPGLALVAAELTLVTRIGVGQMGE